MYNHFKTYHIIGTKIKENTGGSVLHVSRRNKKGLGLT